MIDTALRLLQQANGPAGWYASLAAAIGRLDAADAGPRLQQLIDLALGLRASGPVLLAIARALPPDRPELAVAVTRAAGQASPGTARIELLSGDPGFDRQGAQHELAGRAADRLQGQQLALARLLDHLVHEGDEDVADRWIDTLLAAALDKPRHTRVHAQVVVARVHTTLDRDDDAEHVLTEALELIRACEDEREAAWPTGHMIGALLDGLAPSNATLLGGVLDVVATWPLKARSLFVRGICERLSRRKIPLEPLADLLDGMDVSLESRAIVEAQLAIEEARAGNAQGCVDRLRRGLDVRALGSPMELQDVVGDLPSAAPLVSIAAALAAAGVLDEVAMTIGDMAREAPAGYEQLRWIDAWSVAIARNTEDDAPLLEWLPRGRQMVEAVDIPDLPHIPLETLGTLADLEIRRGDPDRGAWQFRGLERKARAPTNHVLAARRIRAMANVGRLEPLRDAVLLPDHGRALLAEDLVSDGLPGPAATVLEGLRTDWVERVFNAAEARRNHHPAQGDGWLDLARALELNLPLVPEHAQFRCQVTLARLQLLTPRAEDGRVALKRLAMRALDGDSPPHLYLVFLAVMDAMAVGEAGTQ